MPPCEKQLLERAIAGNRDALEELLELHDERLLAYVERRLPRALRSSTCPEDLLQDVYIEAFRAVHTFAPAGEDAFFRWLLTIARNKLLDRIRKHRAAKRGGAAQMRGRPHASEVRRVLVQAPADQLSPSGAAAVKEAMEAVEAAKAGLKTDYRRVLDLRLFEGRSLGTAAGRLGRSERAVHMLFRRAMVQLRAGLGSASRFFSG